MSLDALEGPYTGARVVFIGATGFLGGVTLSMLLQHLPVLGHVHVVLRKTPGVPAARRFAERVLPGKPFDPLRERFGADFEAMVAAKVSVHEGDLTLTDLGLSAETLNALQGQVDVVLNCSGLVDFHAPLDVAYRTNVIGTGHLIDVCRRVGAPLVHTSTCYVAGEADGHVDEVIRADGFPRSRREGADGTAAHLTFDAQAEAADIEREIALVQGALETLPAKARLTEKAIAHHRALNHADPAGSLANAVKRLARDELATALVAAGRERARFWGWPNVYTYTKAIAERLLAASGIRYAVVRPAIIESALAYPLPGWNQNATTSAPLVMLALAGFTRAPASADHVLDIVPVDHVARAILAVGGATRAGNQASVYQVGTSATHPCTMGRITDLIGIHMHEQAMLDDPKPSLKRLWKANHEPKLVDASSFHRDTALFAGAAKLVSSRLEALQGVVDDRALSAWLAKWQDSAATTQADTARAIDLWSMFMPFSHDHDYRFATGNLQALADATQDEVLNITALDWRTYWLDVHIPGLKKWVFKDDLTAKPAIKAVAAAIPLAERMAGAARLDGFRQAQSFGTGARPGNLTYGEYWSVAGQLAEAIAALAPGDAPVAVLADVRAPWPLALLAAWRAGRVPVVIRPRTPDAAAWATGATVRLAIDDPWQARLRWPDGREEVLAMAPEAPRGTITPPTESRTRFWVEDAEAPTELAGRALADRLLAMDPAVPLAGTRMLLPVPAVDDPESDVLALLQLAALYHQASTDIVDVVDWPESVAFMAPTLIAVCEAAWAEAPAKPHDPQAPTGSHPWRGVSHLIDLAPLAARSGAEAYRKAGITIVQPLWDPAATAIVAGRVAKDDELADLPFTAWAPWQVHAAPDGVVHAALGHGEAAPTRWRGRTLDQKDTERTGFRLMGGAMTGDHGRMRAAMLAARALETIELLPLEATAGHRLVLRPHPDRVDGYSALRRQVLHLAWQHNQDASMADRVRSIRLALPSEQAPDDASPLWLDTRRKPVWDAEPELDELRVEVLAFFAPAFPANDFAFFTERLDADTLTFERLASFERVLARGVRQEGLLAQGFLQAFAGELARTRTPVYRLARAFGKVTGKVQRWSADEEPGAPLLPEPMNEAVRQTIAAASMAFYRHGLEVTIHGASYVPAGENFLVVANHASHLDGGLIKFALGPWGRRLHALAAKDYFFGSPTKRLFAHHFTRLIPTDRHRVSSDWLRRSKEVLLNGDCVLIFPEGTRGDGDVIQPFKASVGTLVKAVRVPVLPITITGTADILPKGKALPRGRKATIHLGPPIPQELLLARVADLPPLEQDRAIAQILHDAVVNLPAGNPWWLAAAKTPAALAETSS